MKIVTIVFAVLLFAGCNQSQDAATGKAPPSATSSTVPTVAIDISTPDRALKSYWQAKDALRKAEFEWGATQIPELQKLKGKIGLDLKKLMTSDVLSAHQEIEMLRQGQFEEYSREIVDIKQDTESRATAVVKVRNSTPIAEGIVVSDSDKKQREEGKRFKYVLEKEADGWKVAQVYKFDEYRILGAGNDPWGKVFSTPTGRGSANVYVREFFN